MADEKISALISAGALAGTETLPIVQGGVTKKTTVQDVANLKATPNLQQVTGVGATTTNSISVTNGTDSVNIQPNQIKIANATGYGTIAAGNLTANPNFELPDKLTGTYTFAMLSDITGGGLDLEVNGTPNGNQTLLNLIEGVNIDIADNGTGGVTITSLADRYKTSSLTSVLIGNGSRSFTVDANLAYIPLQEVLIVNSASNHMHGEVTSYNNVTGALVVDVKNHTGGGTYASWVINLDGTPVDAITGVGTANEIAYFTSGQVIASLPVATYPSLTELSYVRGATSAIQTQLNAKKDTILVSVMGTIIVSPLDSTSYHFGIQPWTPNTTAAFRAFKFTDAGTIEKFSFALSQTINGSNQTVTIYLRNVTTSTDNLIGTFTSDFGASTTLKTLITSLSISVNTTDDWTLKILTPAWGTNPSDWVFGGTLSLTKS